MEQKLKIINSLKHEISGRFRKFFSYDSHNIKLEKFLDDSEDIREFKKECFIKLNNLKLDKTTLNACLLEAQDLFSKIQNSREKTVYKKILGSEYFSADSHLLKIALNENILKILINYFGTRPILFDVRLLYSENNEGIEINRDQLWHRDKYDDRSVRLWITLTDCAIEHGPLQYLPHTISKKIFRSYVGRVDDKYIEKKMYNNHIQFLTGNAGDISLIDVHKLVHCGSRIQKGFIRIVFNAIYTSAKPWKKPSLNLNLKNELLKKDLGELQKKFLY